MSPSLPFSQPNFPDRDGRVTAETGTAASGFVLRTLASPLHVYCQAVPITLPFPTVFIEADDRPLPGPTSVFRVEVPTPWQVYSATNPLPSSTTGILSLPYEPAESYAPYCRSPSMVRQFPEAFFLHPNTCAFHLRQQPRASAGNAAALTQPPISSFLPLCFEDLGILEARRNLVLPPTWRNLPGSPIDTELQLPGAYIAGSDPLALARSTFANPRHQNHGYPEYAGAQYPTVPVVAIGADGRDRVRRHESTWSLHAANGLGTVFLRLP